MLIDIANLRLAAENPRKTPADEAAHLSLVASMKAHGQITNILVRPGDKPGLFDIIDGGRRFQAAKAAELEQLKADLYVCRGSRGHNQEGRARQVCCNRLLSQP
jgi:ParB/RepB/Spo0J family partition protein